MNAAFTVKNFETDQQVRWRPGCGDHAILKAVQNSTAFICAGGEAARYRLLPVVW